MMYKYKLYGPQRGSLDVVSKVANTVAESWGLGSRASGVDVSASSTAGIVVLKIWTLF